MSPFIIYVIALTVAYILYYTAIITLDMHSKPKTEGEVEETFDTSDMGETSDEEPPSEDIAEAEEDTVEQQFISDAPEAEPSDEQSQDLQKLFDEAYAQNAEQEEQGHDESQIEEAIEEESDSEEEQVQIEPKIEDEEIEGVSTIAFVEDEPFLLKPQKEEDNSPAFDPNINGPMFGVSEIIDVPKRETDVSRRAETMNNALEMIQTKGNQLDAVMLRDTLLSDEETKKQNIEVRNEFTRA